MNKPTSRTPLKNINGLLMNKTGQLELIRDKINIVDIVREYVPSVKQTGRTFKACCPFHKEKTPSFTVNPDKGLFYCFGCQEGGDVFAFLMKIEGISFFDALKRLADKAGVKLESDKIITKADREIIDIKNALTFAKDYYKKCLAAPEGETAINYIKTRNINQTSVEEFELGFAPDSISAFMQAALKAGISEYILKKAGLVNTKQTDFFRNRLMFPVKNHRGETIAFGGRVMGDAMPKYLNSPETPVFSKSRVLYALNQATRGIREKGYAMLLEGYMDVLMCHQYGLTNCVAGLGTALGHDHAKLIKRYTNDVVLVFDADTPGINAALKGGKLLTEQGLNVRIVMLKEAKDPDEYIKQEGKEKFEQLVAQADDLCAFHIKALKISSRALSPADKSKFAALLLETLAFQPDEIIKAEWRRKIAEALDIDETVLINGMNKQAAQAYKTTPSDTAALQQITFLPCEEDFLRSILKQPQLIRMADELNQEDFSSNKVWQILRKIDRLLDEDYSEAAIVPEISKEFPGESSLLYKLCLDTTPTNPQIFEECIKALKNQSLNRRLKNLKQEIKKHKSGEAPQELAKEIMRISTILKANKS